MISPRIRLWFIAILFFSIVIITWLYVQLTYSAQNVVDPDYAGIIIPQSPGTGTAVVTGNQTINQTTTLVPTSIATARADPGCTLPLAYWNQSQVKLPPQIRANKAGATLVEMCVKYGEIQICAILGEVSSAAEVILRQQFLVTIMNYLSGADPAVIANTVNQAYEWLRAHPSGVSISEADIQTVQLYADTLQSYNQGVIGPGLCDIEIPPTLIVLTPTVTPTPSSTLASVSQTLTITPPSLTSAPTTSRIVITRTRTPTAGPYRDPPDSATPLPPTNTEPPPSDTPPSPPQPTDTEAPPPATSTDLPTPTPVPEEDTPTPVP